MASLSAPALANLVPCCLDDVRRLEDLGPPRGRPRPEQGRGFPADFSVVGFDDIPFAATTVSAPTTIRMPVEGMIRGAVEMVVDKTLRNAAAGPKGVRAFRSSLVVRRSTAKCEPADLRQLREPEEPLRGLCRRGSPRRAAPARVHVNSL